MSSVKGENSAYTITINNEVYTRIKTLAGRGQSGMAGFFSQDVQNKNQSKWLIKEDNPGTCLAEALMINYLPEGLNPQKPCVLQAQLEISTIENNKKPVSKQPTYALNENEKELKVQDFGTLIFGKKHDPKTWRSQESSHAKQIKGIISGMSKPVKRQLAAAIFISQLNGDESLHTGQFMVKIDKKNQIQDIVRIDFGALGRYAQARQDFDPFNTSSLYSKSGQFGKNYVSYLLQDDQVRDQVLAYWKNINIDDVVQQITDRFNHQIKNLHHDPALQQKAVQKFYQALTKGSTDKKLTHNKSPSIEEVRSLFIKTTKTRCEQMQAAAYMRSIGIEAKKQVKNYPGNMDIKLFIRQMDKIIKDTKTPATERLKNLEAMINDPKQLAQKETGLSRLIQFIKNLLPTSQEKIQTLQIEKNQQKDTFITFKNQLKSIVPNTQSCAQDQNSVNPSDLGSESQSYNQK